MNIVVPDDWSRELLLACVDREIRLREKAYPRWVQLGRMSHKKMTDEIAAMKAVRCVLAQLPATVPPQVGLLFGEGK